MLPNKLVWSYTDNKTYLEIYGDKVVHIFTYLELHRNKLGRTVFDIKSMIEFCGITPKRGKGKSIEQFKNILIDLQDKKIIEIEIDIAKSDITDLIECVFYMPIDKNKESKNIRFFNIKIKDYLKIINLDKKINKLTLLKIYYYINSRISRRETIEIDDRKIKQDDIARDGGKASCFYDSFNNISKDLHITEDTFSKYIKILNELGLVFTDNIGIVTKDEKKHIANNVYVVNKDEMQEALKQSKLYYEGKGFIITTNKDKEKIIKKIKKINGLKGKIKQQQNANKDTHKLEKKLNKLADDVGLDNVKKEDDGNNFDEANQKDLAKDTMNISKKLIHKKKKDGNEDDFIETKNQTKDDDVDIFDLVVNARLAKKETLDFNELKKIDEETTEKRRQAEIDRDIKRIWG